MRSKINLRRRLHQRRRRGEHSQPRLHRTACKRFLLARKEFAALSTAFLPVLLLGCDQPVEPTNDRLSLRGFHAFWPEN